MKALILNSGLGSRMGDLVEKQPKCMTDISKKETIISRQLRQLCKRGIREVIITTGLFDGVLVNYCQSLNLDVEIIFIKNPLYKETNYIYSIFCAREYLNDDIILMHGDMVFEDAVLDELLEHESSCMAISSTLMLPEKDFKAVIQDKKISKIGIEFFNNSVAAQPLYKLDKKDWQQWLDKIIEFCEADNSNCYAEAAFNEISDKCVIYPLDIKNSLCSEVDTPEDLAVVANRLKEIEQRTVYMCFSTDMLHSGHISIIKKAASLGKLIIGVLSDEAVAGYKRFPLLPFEERKTMFENITDVYKVVEQRTLSYKENLEKYLPTYVVHGNDWLSGFQKPIRDEVVSILAGYGGRLVEYPYANEEKYMDLEKRARAEISTPDIRRARLRKMLTIKGLVTAIETHSGLTGLIAENTIVNEDGGAHQFDAMWVSSLCDSTAKGKPDIELVDMTSRFRTIDDIMEVTTKPIIFDGDTGGQTEHFIYTVRTLERMGVSMIIIEDKTGLKKNSLFGTEVEQTQASIDNFSDKIRAGKNAQRTKEFMICARIESLILERGMDDAIERAFAFVEAGADAIMIHSRRKESSEIFEFVTRFRDKDTFTPIVVVPTSFNDVTEEEFKDKGVNVVIYANQLTRTGFPAMQNAAEMILKNHRAKECDDTCMPFKDIIRLIPEDN
ncbi:MAG: phosphoenolpyruvate mutase [Suipraeoptans sp.]